MAKKFFEPCSGEKNFCALLGGSGGMLLKKNLKIYRLRSSENAFESSESVQNTSETS